MASDVRRVKGGVALVAGIPALPEPWAQQERLHYLEHRELHHQGVLCLLEGEQIMGNQLGHLLLGRRT